MLFTGQYEHTIDSKGRLALPSEIRALVHPDTHGDHWYLGPGMTGVLCLWPQKTFEAMAASFSSNLLQDPAIAEWEQMMFSLSARLDVDNAGRIRIPERLREHFSLSDSVVVVGARDHLEIIDASAWSRSKLTPERMKDIWRQAAIARRSADAEGR